jgi:hypothetical protein
MADPLPEPWADPWAAIRASPAAKKWRIHCETMANRFKGRAKGINIEPPDVRAFVRQGGMRAIEYAIGVRAAEEAIKAERKSWLARLELWVQFYKDEDYFRAELQTEIKRLRRCLGISKEVTPEERRAQVRERVRKHRASKKR